MHEQARRGGGRVDDLRTLEHFVQAHALLGLGLRLRAGGRQGAEGRGDIGFLAFTDQSDLHLIARSQQPDRVAQRARITDVGAVDGGDDVVDADPSMLGRRVRAHSHDERARVVVQLVRGRYLGRNVVDTDPQQTTAHSAEADQLFHDRARHVHGNREPDADVAA